MTTASGMSASGFELNVHRSSNQSPLHTIFLLAGGAMPPVMRVLIVATINGMPQTF